VDDRSSDGASVAMCLEGGFSCDAASATNSVLHRTNNM
jgi:hypothetical protein